MQLIKRRLELQRACDAPAHATGTVARNYTFGKRRLPKSPGFVFFAKS